MPSRYYVEAVVTVYVFRNPRTVAIDWMKSRLGNYPAGTTVSANFPTALTGHHIQVGWDGTPGQEVQRETAAIRVTYWTPKGAESAAIDGASQAHKDMLELANTAAWRTTKGAGRTPGVDPDTGLPFCTFTVNADIRPV